MPLDMIGSSRFDVKDSRICRTPKKSNITPPSSPVKGRIIGWSTTVENPKAKTTASGNSNSMCPKEKNNPPFAPDRVPCETVAKNKGPGAKAPEAVTRITVETKLRVSKSFGLPITIYVCLTYLVFIILAKFISPMTMT